MASVFLKKIMSAQPLLFETPQDPIQSQSTLTVQSQGRFSPNKAHHLVLLPPYEEDKGTTYAAEPSTKRLFKVSFVTERPAVDASKEKRYKVIASEGPPKWVVLEKVPEVFWGSHSLLDVTYPPKMFLHPTLGQVSIEKPLGKGAHSQAYTATASRMPHPLVIKFPIDRASDDSSLAYTNETLSRHLPQSQFSTQIATGFYYDLRPGRSGTPCIFQTEYCINTKVEGVEIADLAKESQISKKTLGLLIKKLLESCSTLWDHRLVHLDLSSHNVFWDQKTQALGIIDFSNAQPFSDKTVKGQKAQSQANEMQESILPPEILRGDRPMDILRGETSVFNRLAADVWQMGMLILTYLIPSLEASTWTGIEAILGKSMSEVGVKKSAAGRMMGDMLLVSDKTSLRRWALANGLTQIASEGKTAMSAFLVRNGVNEASLTSEGVEIVAELLCHLLGPIPTRVSSREQIFNHESQDAFREKLIKWCDSLANSNRVRIDIV